MHWHYRQLCKPNCLTTFKAAALSSACILPGGLRLKTRCWCVTLHWSRDNSINSPPPDTITIIIATMEDWATITSSTAASNTIIVPPSPPEYPSVMLLHRRLSYLANRCKLCKKHAMHTLSLAKADLLKNVANENSFEGL